MTLDDESAFHKEWCAYFGVRECDCGVRESRLLDDYPIARDSAGPFDVTVKLYEDGQEWVCRAPWRKLPTLADCHAYIVHGQNLTSEKIALSLPMD